MTKTTPSRRDLLRLSVVAGGAATMAPIVTRFPSASAAIASQMSNRFQFDASDGGPFVGRRIARRVGPTIDGR